MEIREKLIDITGGKLKENELLAPYTTLRIGGPAKYFHICNNVNEIIKLIEVCLKSKLPYFVLGGGSNVLVNDLGFNGLVIKFNASKIKIKGDLLECEGGAFLNKIVGESISLGFINFIWATGIPGTIGGAVHGNAGAFGGDMSQSVQEVTILRNGKLKKLKNKDCHFAYRESVFKEEENKDIIVSVKLKLERGDLEAAKQKMKEILIHKKERFSNFLTAGSIFKNPELDPDEVKEFKDRFSKTADEFIKSGRISAAWLIDQCELRGKKIGQAQICENHAGTIRNLGNAKAEEIIMLVSIIKQKVRSKFNIQLQEEVEYVGFGQNF